MKAWKKEILLCVVALFCAGIAVWYTLQSVESGKKAETTNLFSLIPEDTYSLVQINKPASFIAFSRTDSIFTEFIPSLFKEIIPQHGDASSVLFSSHPQGDILFMKLTEKQAETIHCCTLPALFPDFAPQQIYTEDIGIYYFAGSGNRFFGSFYRDGVWAGSYSRKLLEQVGRLFNGAKNARPWDTLRKKTDPKAMLNIYLDGYVADLSVMVNDSVWWDSKGEWLPADIFISDNNVCMFTPLPVHIPDSVFAHSAPVVGGKWESLFSGKELLMQYQPEEEGLYCTLCLPIDK